MNCNESKKFYFWKRYSVSEGRRIPDLLVAAEAARQLSHQNEARSEVFVAVETMYLFVVYFIFPTLFYTQMDSIK